MKIVLLMGGLGARFAAVGYKKAKPLIRVDGKSIVEHVVSMYSGDHEFLFVCNESMRGDNVLSSLEHKLPHSEMIYIPTHKLGPVHTLSSVWHNLRREDPVLVSYTDFYVDWDFNKFMDKIDAENWDGAVPCYTGFHPHLLRNNKYAGVEADSSGKMLRIREKHCFTPNPEDSFHSAGIYFFSKADDLIRHGEALMRSGKTLNGEYYVSMIYYSYLANMKRILVYPLTHFLQWGTPEDLEEYEAWSRLIIGMDKGVTYIPPNRKQFVKIQYGKETEEYGRSLDYWIKYFSS